MTFAIAPLLVVLAGGAADQLPVAHARGDHDEVARLAGQAGAAGIAPLLDRDRIHALAAIAAAPDAPDAWELLGPLARVAGDWDRQLAARAAHAAARIARDLDPDQAILLDMPDDALATRQDAWLELARREDRWTDVRVHALEVVAAIAGARRATAEEDPALGYDLADFLADPDPELRRAACELVPQPTPAAIRPVLAAAIADDADPAVALACAQALCADLAHDRRSPIVAAISDAAAARLHAIAKGRLPDVPGGALVDAARCLAARRRPADLAALRLFQAKAPRQLRGMMMRVGRK